MENTQKVCCPKCGSESLTANKKGFSGNKAAAGAILTGGVGLLAGTIGSNKIVIACLNCGHQWKPGIPPVAKATLSEETLAKRRKVNKVVLIVFAVVILLIILISKFG